MTATSTSIAVFQYTVTPTFDISTVSSDVLATNSLFVSAANAAASAKPATTTGNSSQGTSTGTIVGSVVGSVAGVALIGIALLLFFTHHRKQKRDSYASSDSSMGSRAAYTGAAGVHDTRPGADSDDEDGGPAVAGRKNPGRAPGQKPWWASVVPFMASDNAVKRRRRSTEPLNNAAGVLPEIVGENAVPASNPGYVTPAPGQVSVTGMSPNYTRFGPSSGSPESFPNQPVYVPTQYPATTGPANAGNSEGPAPFSNAPAVVAIGNDINRNNTVSTSSSANSNEPVGPKKGVAGTAPTREHNSSETDELNIPGTAGVGGAAALRSYYRAPRRLNGNSDGSDHSSNYNGSNPSRNKPSTSPVSPTSADSQFSSPSPLPVADSTFAESQSPQLVVTNPSEPRDSIDAYGLKPKDSIDQSTSDYPRGDPQRDGHNKNNYPQNIITPGAGVAPLNFNKDSTVAYDSNHFAPNNATLKNQKRSLDLERNSPSLQSESPSVSGVQRAPSNSHHVTNPDSFLPNQQPPLGNYHPGHDAPLNNHDNPSSSTPPNNNPSTTRTITPKPSVNLGGSYDNNKDPAFGPSKTAAAALAAGTRRVSLPGSSPVSSNFNAQHSNSNSISSISDYYNADETNSAENSETEMSFNPAAGFGAHTTKSRGALKKAKVDDSDTLNMGPIPSNGLNSNGKFSPQNADPRNGDSVPISMVPGALPFLTEPYEEEDNTKTTDKSGTSDGDNTLTGSLPEVSLNNNSTPEHTTYSNKSDDIAGTAVTTNDIRPTSTKGSYNGVQSPSSSNQPQSPNSFGPRSPSSRQYQGHSRSNSLAHAPSKNDGFDFGVAASPASSDSQSSPAENVNYNNISPPNANNIAPPKDALHTPRSVGPSNVARSTSSSSSSSFGDVPSSVAFFGDDHTNNIDPNLVGTNPTYGPSEPAGSHQTSNSVPAPSTNFYDPRELGDLEAPPLIPGVRGSGLNSGSHNRKDSTNSVNSDKSLSSEAWSMQTTPEQQQYEAFRTPPLFNSNSVSLGDHNSPDDNASPSTSSPNAGDVNFSPITPMSNSPAYNHIRTGSSGSSSGGNKSDILDSGRPKGKSVGQLPPGGIRRVDSDGEQDEPLPVSSEPKPAVGQNQEVDNGYDNYKRYTSVLENDGGGQEVGKNSYGQNLHVGPRVQNDQLGHVSDVGFNGEEYESDESVPVLKSTLTRSPRVIEPQQSPVASIRSYGGSHYGNSPTTAPAYLHMPNSMSSASIHSRNPPVTASSSIYSLDAAATTASSIHSNHGIHNGSNHALRNFPTSVNSPTPPPLSANKPGQVGFAASSVPYVGMSPATSGSTSTAGATPVLAQESSYMPADNNNSHTGGNELPESYSFGSSNPASSNAQGNNEEIRNSSHSDNSNQSNNAQQAYYNPLSANVSPTPWQATIHHVDMDDDGASNKSSSTSNSILGEQEYQKGYEGRGKPSVGPQRANSRYSTASSASSNYDDASNASFNDEERGVTNNLSARHGYESGYYTVSNR